MSCQGEETFGAEATHPSQDVSNTNALISSGLQSTYRDGLTTAVAEQEDFLMDGFDDGDSMSGMRSFEHKERSQECASEILDMECGEPIKSQHLRIDFSPLIGVDDSEFLLNKCISFWKLIEGSKKLQELKAFPEKHMEAPEPSVKSAQSDGSSLNELPTPKLEAVDVMERKGQILDDCFMNKMKPRYCEEGSGDYFVDSPHSKSGALPKWTTPSKSSRRLASRAQREELTKLCTELDQWDSDHPKSMAPPNHGPPHTYAVMQRN